MKREIAVSEQEAHRHFSEIAPKYRELRTTDSEPILHIKKRLNGKSRISVADVGCGDGRYSLKLWQCFGDRCYLHCVDANENMLIHLENYFDEKRIRNFRVIKSDAEKLPLENNSMDCIITFNAIHHFDISKFLQQASRALNDDGSLFIYTRLKSQNMKNIWGKHFPFFTKKENRLYELDELKEKIENENMTVNSVKNFQYNRSSSLDMLVSKANNKHYSTFEFYDGEFGNSVKEFIKNIKQNFQDLDNITWQDEYTLLEIRN